MSDRSFRLLGVPSIDVRTRRRVAPLAPGDRRAALIEATIPLLRAHGLAVSTRQIAEAAGVAEGTIFRVFPDKTSLVFAATLQAMDPQPVIDALGAIPAGTPLRASLTIVADVMVRRMADSGPLLTIFRELAASRHRLDDGRNGNDRLVGDQNSDTRPADPHNIAAGMHATHARICTAIAEIIEPHRDELRLSPAAAARLFLSTVVAASGLVFGEKETTTGDEIVAILLDGLLVRQAPTTSESPC